MALPGENPLPMGVEKTEKRYRPILEIGSGGMSRVYLAVASGPGGMQKFHVIKRLLPTLSEDPEFLNMFLEEARLSARLNHPNVVQINEVGFDGEHYFMAMEYLEGQSLETLVRWASRRGGLPFGMYARVLVDAAQGLHYAHELCDYDGTPLGVVHRDISPHNVFVTYQGGVKLLDFGIAKAADSVQHTRTGMLKGKVEYMAPERFARGASSDRRTDVFALGVMLWQAAAQRRLWEGLSHIEVFQRLSAGDVPALRSVVPDAPEALMRLCDLSLAADPAKRLPTASAFAEELDAYLDTTHQQIRPRELAAYISDAFAERRAQTRSAIEQALQRPPPSSGHAPLGSYSVNELPTLTEGSVREAEGLGAMSAGPGDALSSLPNFGIPRGLALTPTGVPPAPTLVSASLHGNGSPKQRSVWLWAVTALIGGLALAGGLGVLPSLLRDGPAPAPSAAHATPPASASNAVREVPPTLLTRVLVAASPAQAQLFIDEVPLSSNPASAAFLRDSQLHRVRAEAPGYRGEIKLVAYDVQEQVVTLNLQRESASAPPPVPARPRDSGKVVAPTVASPPPTAAPPPPPPQPTSDDLPIKPPPRPSAPKLDRDSPW